jgi:hypothetical protein
MIWKGGEVWQVAGGMGGAGRHIIGAFPAINHDQLKTNIMYVTCKNKTKTRNNTARSLQILKFYKDRLSPCLLKILKTRRIKEEYRTGRLYREIIPFSQIHSDTLPQLPSADIHTHRTR